MTAKKATLADQHGALSLSLFLSLSLDYGR